MAGAGQPATEQMSEVQRRADEAKAQATEAADATGERRVIGVHLGVRRVRSGRGRRGVGRLSRYPQPLRARRRLLMDRSAVPPGAAEGSLLRSRRRCPWRGTFRGGGGATRRRTGEQRLEGLLERIADRRDRLAGCAVRAAERLGDELVDHAELVQVLGGQPHRLRRRGASSPLRHRIAAQPSGEITEYTACSSINTRSATARRPHRRAALADDRPDRGHAELQAGLDRARDRLGLAALLGADPG